MMMPKINEKPNGLYDQARIDIDKAFPAGDYVITYTPMPDMVQAALQDATDQSKRWHAMWTQRGDRLLKLAAELEEMTRQRDMLATRCAEQAKQIQKHLIGNPYIDQARDPKQRHAALADAIAVMQRAGVR